MQLGKGKACSVTTFWLEQWFSTQIVPTTAGVSKICGGGFHCYMIGGTVVIWWAGPNNASCPVMHGTVLHNQVFPHAS